MTDIIGILPRWLTTELSLSAEGNSLMVRQTGIHTGTRETFEYSQPIPSGWTGELRSVGNDGPAIVGTLSLATGA